MLRIFFLWFFIVSLCSSEQYPQTFKQLSHPLFNALPAIQKLSKIPEINALKKTYTQDVELAIELGVKVDKTLDSHESKKYLFILRQLQKKYDSILHEIHKQIDIAMTNQDYQAFSHLISYEFEGLLKSRTLYKKALAFYTKNKGKHKNIFFENKIKYQQIQEATSTEFFNIAKTATYNSLNKKNKKRKVNLEAKESGDYIAVYLENFHPYTVSVEVQGKYENLIQKLTTKKVVSLKGNSKIEYLRLYKNKGADLYSYNMSYSWIIGSVDAVHDDTYIYRLPFAKGSSQRVSQGYNGEYTHKGHSRYAIDFAMDVGTEVYAARNGVVVKLKENSNKGGDSRKFSRYGNYVTIEHDDSTLATYYHLRQYGVIPKIGDKIQRGDLIAYSGNTGYSSGPHLHLAVFKARNARSTQTIKIKLLGVDGTITIPQRNKFYTAK